MEAIPESPALPDTATEAVPELSTLPETAMVAIPKPPVPALLALPWIPELPAPPWLPELLACPWFPGASTILEVPCPAFIHLFTCLSTASISGCLPGWILFEAMSRLPNIYMAL